MLKATGPAVVRDTDKTRSSEAAAHKIQNSGLSTRTEEKRYQDEKDKSNVSAVKKIKQKKPSGAHSPPLGWIKCYSDELGKHYW